MCPNVPEHRLVGHPAIRRACAENRLGLVWCAPSFWSFAKEAKGQEATQVAFLQSLLDGLAAVSGYDEVGTVPWLPMGESGHLLMVTGLIDQRPERCIAGICIKNPQYPKDRTVPLLWTLGTAQEWGQTKADPRTSWNNPTGSYDGWCGTRAGAGWPLSVLIEPGTGHFYCTDAMTEYFAEYIGAAVKARLPESGTELRPVDLDAGFLAHLPVPGRENGAVEPHAGTQPPDRKRPWYFDASLAKAAQAISQTNWKAATQIPSIEAGDGCTVAPFSFNSVTQVTVATDSEFSLRGVMLDAVPEGFVGAGEKLAKTAGSPRVEWVCGPFAPVGEGRFRVALDRTWKAGAAYLAVIKEGDAEVRFSLQPAGVKLVENTEGSAQTITFEPLPDVPAGTRSIPLKAVSDSGLPVQFFVGYGPATVSGNELVLTPIPPRAKYPVEVSVTAWQWGRPGEPKVKMATPVTRVFRITSG
jgi:hypothetical protein